MTTTPSAARRAAKATTPKKAAKSAASSALRWKATPKRAGAVKEVSGVFLIRDLGLEKAKPGIYKGAERIAFKGVQMRRLTPAKAYLSDTFDVVDIVRHGLPAVNVEALSTALHLDKGIVTGVLGLPRSTVDKKIKGHKDLTREQSERVIGLQRLIGQVEVIVAESGDATDFDAGEWLSRWIRKPLPALGGRKPDEFLDTVLGQQLVSKLLAQIQSGAYA